VSQSCGGIAKRREADCSDKESLLDEERLFHDGHLDVQYSRRVAYWEAEHEVTARVGAASVKEFTEGRPRGLCEKGHRPIVDDALM
jgi:hypothetical protein